jgi:hypothetical protein
MSMADVPVSNIYKENAVDAVEDRLRCWRWEILEHLPYSPHMIREVMISSPLLDINRRGRADGVRRLPQIWQKVVQFGVIMLKQCACLPQVIKSFQNYTSVATIFHPTLVMNMCLYLLNAVGRRVVFMSKLKILIQIFKT